MTNKEGGAHQGEIVLTSEELIQSRDFFQFSFEVIGLPTGFFTKNHFIEIRRADENGQFRLVRRTDKKPGRSIVENFSISGQDLNNGDNDRTLQFQLYHHKGSGSHKLLGDFEASGNDLKENGREFQFNKTKIKLAIRRSRVDQKFSFLDYLHGGMQMNFVVAIDFTASNGDPSRSDSLHYNNRQEPNQYIQAIRAVGEIIEDYDSDKLFPVYGFGARIPPTGQVSHMFPCNFNNENPFVERLDGIIGSYMNAIQQIQLYGPTNFAPIIRQTAQMAREHQNQNEYFVLLIITDGVITDMEATKRAIVENSNLPFSIIIVGVGGADFDSMDELDSDDSLLTWQVGCFKSASRIALIFIFLEYQSYP